MPELPVEKNIPLVVDLDGTLIKTDLLWESLKQYLGRNPLGIATVLWWWTRGRAFLKQKLGQRVTLNPATLPVSETFLNWLREEKAAGRQIILATASDYDKAKPVADYFGIFEEVLASNGRVNLRGANKLKALEERFGKRGFDYAGNSSVDLAVWRGAHGAIVVNGGRSLEKRAAQCANVLKCF